MRHFCLALFVAAISAQPVPAQQVLVEAEGFAQHGGWSLDTQFIQIMGSPYLLAHGLGRPVADAIDDRGTPGSGHVPGLRAHQGLGRALECAGAPGRFQVLVNGKPLPRDVRHAGSRLVLAGRRHRGSRRTPGDAGPARPDGLRRPLRRDPVHRTRTARAAERVPGSGRVAPAAARPCRSADREERLRSGRGRAAATRAWARRSPRRGWAARWP